MAAETGSRGLAAGWGSPEHTRDIAVQLAAARTKAILAMADEVMVSGDLKAHPVAQVLTGWLIGRARFAPRTWSLRRRSKRAPQQKL
jgi:hypothetical protein